MVSSKKFMTLVSLNKKKWFFKNVGKRRLVDTHTKPKNRKDANPIRYFQNLKITRKRHLVDTCKISKKIVETQRFSWYPQPKSQNKNKGSEKPQNSKIVGRRHSIDTHKTKFLRKKQRGDIQSILAPKSARKRHSIDTSNRMSKEATFHRYLQYHSAGRPLLVDTCIF